MTYNFKIRDKVEVTSLAKIFLSYTGFNIGLTGEVVDANDNIYIGIRWNLKEPLSQLHSCNEKCDWGYGWYMYYKEIRLVPIPPINFIEDTEEFSKLYV